MRLPRSVLPLADAPALARTARRTTLVRAALAALLALLLALAFLSARRRELAARERGSVGEVVALVDVSASVSDADASVAATLDALVRSERKQGVGLVLFADVAEEALPPGTPSDELARFVRFFPREGRGGAAASSVDEPWSPGLGAGTRISQGLRAAREALARDAGGRGRVVLVSDLAAAATDLPRLRRELRAYRRNPLLDLQVVALPTAAVEDRRFFRSYLGGASFVRPSATALSEPMKGSRASASELPLLPLVVVLVALVLALVELVAMPLEWKERAPERSEG